MPIKCEGGCGKTMPMTDGQRRCGACRAKKYRLRKKVMPDAYSMGFKIDAWSKMLNDGSLDLDTGREVMNAVWDRIWEMNEQLKRLEAVAAAKAAEKDKKRR